MQLKPLEVQKGKQMEILTNPKNQRKIPEVKQ